MNIKTRIHFGNIIVMGLQELITTKMLLLSLLVLSSSCYVNSDPLTVFGVLVPKSLGNLWSIAEFVHSLGGKIKDSYDVHSTATDDTSLKIDAILSQVSEISDKIGSFETGLIEKLNGVVETLVARITLTDKVNIETHQLRDVIEKVDHMWSNFVKYSEDLSKFNNRTIQAFISAATEEHEHLQSWLSTLHRILVPGRSSPLSDSLFQTMLRLEAETAQLTCGQGFSNQQELYHLYEIVTLTELRGFIMAASAYGLRSKFDGEKYIGEVDIIETRFILRLNDYISAVKEAMKQSSNSIRRCDPAGEHVDGLTYVEMKRLFQTYIVNEADIDIQDSCFFGCNLQVDTTHQRRDLANYHYEYNPPCEGTITKCETAPGTIDLCIEGTGSEKRYSWFKGTDGTVWGDTSRQCTGPKRRMTYYWRFLYICEYCICTCEADRADRKTPPVALINFLPSESDIQDNRVVIGVKIVQEENIIHIQIREGKLAAKGEIVKGSETWVPLKNLRHINASEYSYNGNKLTQGKDYDVIHRNGRTITLNDVIVPKGHVVVGVRFKHMYEPTKLDYNPTRIEVLSIPFDYMTGKLSLKANPQWHHTTPLRDWEEIKYDRPDEPLKSKHNIPTMQSNLYVKFTHTDPKKTAGQTTIPLWDSQTVVTSPSFPLEGIGLFHKGDEKGHYGGFLGLRIHTYNFVDHISQEMPPQLQHKYEKVLPKLLN